jgi:DNA-binding SARP family transcriptional activator
MARQDDISVESVRRLQRWSAEYLRVAAELEATEQELRQQVDEFLASLPQQAKSHLPDWLKTLAREAPDETGADVAALMLGPLELDVAGRRVARWSSLKARAVFQYLLIHRDRPVRRDVLMELQWPGHTYTSARNNLNVALYSLRSTLDGPWHGLQPILYQDGCYALNPGLNWRVDRDEFLAVLGQADLARASGQPRQAICHYQRAIQLYRGPLFEDDLTGDWYLAEQRHLNELYLQALERLGEIHFDLGEIASAKFYGQLALSSDSCCEPVHRLLMRCHAAENKQQLVTRQYRLCVDALHDELDVSPGAETLRLFRELTLAP